MMKNTRLLLVLIFTLPYWGISQVTTKTAILQSTADQMAAVQQDNYINLMTLAKQKGWPITIKGLQASVARLTGIDSAGYPLYTSVLNNTIAAATTGTNTLWPGGSSGLNLSGASNNMRGKLGIWDEGLIRATHIELQGKIFQKDNPTSPDDHATHVAGTLTAKGINPIARGMAFGLQQLIAYDFDNDVQEMFGEANNLLVSNHSYGIIAGWRFNSDQSRWEFRGEVGANEDFRFGFYDNKTQLWDSIAFNAPFYLVVASAGNSRNQNGPAVGQPYWRPDANGTMVNAGNRPAGILNNDGYDIISSSAGSKNILTIGAANGLAAGYSQPTDVILSGFSAWGPTDDGRIKPDVVADGVNVTSSIATSDNSYGSLSGTSMSSPNASGSLFLLQEQYSKQKNGLFMRAATLKGLAIHTADEAGQFDGPDYQYGWGLLNVGKAASVITANNTDKLIFENVLNNNATFLLPVVASGKGSLIATISWTDPKGTVDFARRLNDPTKKLVNDLDIVVRSGNNTFLPYILNPASPALPASTGDNITDNVEKIVINNVIPGQAYTIEVKHKRTLERSQQAYSLLVSGVGGKAYCTSTPTSNAGTRIDSVSLGSFRFANPAGCTTYNNFTNSTISLQGNQSITFSVRVGSCDASVANKIVKAFIDWNNDGDFDDVGENIATSGVISGNGVYTTTITTPATVTENDFTVLRIVVQETATATDVLPCGSYARGETQDFRITILPPSNDVAITDIIAPATSACSNNAQLITVRVRNFGSTGQRNIPLRVEVKRGAALIANLQAVYPLTLLGQSDAAYTFQSPVNLTDGQYTLAAYTKLAVDQKVANDTFRQNVIILSASTPIASAGLCSPTEARLVATPSGLDVPYWFDSPTATAPFASGNNVTTAAITANKTFYVQKNLKTNVGAKNKNEFVLGEYGPFSGPYITFSNNVPVVIESARLYIGNAGKITVTVADLISTTGTSFTFRPISAIQLDVYPTTPTPQAGNVQGNNPADTGAVFYLNLPVNAVGDHIIIIQCSEGATIFRNTGVTGNPYPYTIPGVFSINGNSAQQTNNPSFFQNFYFFLYNIRIATAGCESRRIPIVASDPLSPVITVAGNLLTSNLPNGNQWYRNNIAISGANGTTYTATEAGVYTVLTIDQFGCIVSSNEINFVVTAIVDVNGTEIGLKVSPNPGNGLFVLNFEVKGKDDLNISLVNALGQKVYQATYPGFTGRFNRVINVGMPGRGVYTLRIDHNKKIYVKSIIIQ